jgi:hypothetical protein
MNMDPAQTKYPVVPEVPEPVPYTLRIGITGHRNLDNPDAVSKAVDGILLMMKKSLEKGMIDLHQPQVVGISKWQRIEANLAWNSKRILATSGILPKLTETSRQTPLNWSVISSLAKGADRIVARSAMDKLNASLEVILPFDVNEYRKDFNTQDDLEEFNQLFGRANNKATLQNITFPENKTRQEGYEQAGIEVVDSCEILITVWDGKAARGRGGTAEIIRYACSINRPVIWINALEPESPPVLIKNIQSNTDNPERNSTQNLQVVKETLPKHAAEWSARFMQVAEYNRDSAFSQIDFEKTLKSNFDKFEEAREKTALLPEEINPILNKLLPHYTRADLLAIKYQKLHIRSATWLYRLAAIAVTIAVLQTLYLPEQTAWVTLEIMSLLGAIVWFRISIIQHWHEKWLNYRHLAERIRILLFHSLGGKQAATPSIQNQQLPFYPGPGGWVVDVFDQINKGIPLVNIAEDKLQDVKKIVIEEWISDQVKYHHSNSIRKEHLARMDHLLIGGMLLTTLVAAVLHLFKAVHPVFLENLIVAIVIVLPSFAAAQHAIGSIHDYERIATRSARMKEILLSLQSSINRVNSWEELSIEIQRAEDIMSAENHEWCVSLGFRRVSLPV